jgi:hypothetical protein
MTQPEKSLWDKSLAELTPSDIFRATLILIVLGFIIVATLTGFYVIMDILFK